MPAALIHATVCSGPRLAPRSGARYIIRGEPEPDGGEYWRGGLGGGDDRIGAGLDGAVYRGGGE